MKIEILCTGDEILTGKTVNTNYSYMAQRLTEAGLQVHWGTTVGDDHQSLSRAFQQASERADAVIVNGGLGPTVDDLSQELAAQAAGVTLELHEPWLEKLEAFYRSRGRVMTPNNRKQAMLPAGSEFIDNPIGTACGFVLDIGGARFFFTPGVPREMRRMVTEQVIPRLLQMSGFEGVTRLKRFHSFGIGESRADQLLDGINELLPDSVKLGFQSHFPQLETKLAAVGGSETELDEALAPAEQMIRERFGNAILCEDAQTLEGIIIEQLHNRGETIATMEMASGGTICNRLTNADNDGTVVHSGVVGRQLAQLADASGFPGSDMRFDVDHACRLAEHLRERAGTNYAVIALAAQEPPDENQQSSADVIIAIATEETVISRSARMMGGREWIQLGSAEMALDALRRFLFDLPLDEKTDFELQQ
ncbi:MAG: CinA family nicotinamide mononucleotide deamidase-related protein [Granulosicoccus sp.]